MYLSAILDPPFWILRFWLQIRKILYLNSFNMPQPFKSLFSQLLIFLRVWHVHSRTKVLFDQKIITSRYNWNFEKPTIFNTSRTFILNKFYFFSRFRKKMKATNLKLLVQSLGKFLSVMWNFFTRTYPKFITFHFEKSNSEKLIHLLEIKKVYLIFIGHTFFKLIF